MINSKSLASLTMVLLMLICFPAQAEFGGIMSDIGPLDAYDDMLTFFELKDYDAARDIIKTYGLVENQVKDALLYSNYMDALAYMDIEKFDLASYLFDGLRQGSDSFLDSELLYHYCTGRFAEANGDYDQAISSYTQAAAYGDSAQRMLECIEQREQSMLLQAKESYDTAILLQDVEMLETAAQLYTQLGNSQMAAEIRAEIQALEDKQVYDSAVASMEKARAEGDKATLTQLSVFFDTLGDYADSAALAKTCRELVSLMSRAITIIDIQADVNTLQITWNDTVAGDSYVIQYAPENVQETTEITTTDQQITLVDLLPDTIYTISVKAEDDNEYYTSQSVATLPADNYLYGAFAVRAGRLIGVKRSYLNHYTLEELLDSKQNALVYFDNNRLPLENIAPSLQQMTYCFVFTYTCETNAEEPVEILWLLRTEHTGVYALKQPEPAMLETSGRLYLELESLLEAVFQQEKAWPDGTLTLELYIDGLLGGKGAIILEAE